MSGLVNVARFLLRHPLSQGHQVENFLRFVKWQIGSRLVPGPVAVDFVNGARLLIKPGLTGATGNVYVGLHEFEDMAFVLHMLRPGDLFVDVGANIGSYTTLASAAVGAQSMAFEPGAAAYEWLQRNVDLNRMGSLVDLRQQAVGAKAGTLRMTVGRDAVNHVILEPNGDESSSCNVPVVTLDSALAGKEPSLIKIDVEGFETAVVGGGPATFARPTLRAVLMELNGSGQRYGFDEDALAARMRDWGFDVLCYAPFSRSLSRSDTAGAWGNSLFVRDRPFVESRLRDAPPFAVHGRTI